MLKIKVFTVTHEDDINDFMKNHHVLKDGILFIQEGHKVAISYNDSYGLGKYGALDLIDELLVQSEKNLMGKTSEMEGLVEELKDARLTKEEANILNKQSLELTRLIKSNEYMVNLYKKKLDGLLAKK